jgi:hypothetical protein
MCLILLLDYFSRILVPANLSLRLLFSFQRPVCCACVLRHPLAAEMNSNESLACCQALLFAFFALRLLLFFLLYSARLILYSPACFRNGSVFIYASATGVNPYCKKFAGQFLCSHGRRQNYLISTI